jgi:hypothetical protein
MAERRKRCMQQPDVGTSPMNTHLRRTGPVVVAAAAALAVVAGCAASGPSQVVVGSGGSSRPATPPASTAAKLACPMIAGLPNTENGIFDLTARGTTCAAATALGTSALQTHRGAAFSANGFTCASRYEATGYKHYRYTCTSGAQQVTFVYSR